MNSTNFCIQCGNHLEPDTQFCPKCGTKIEAATIESQTKKAPSRTVPLVSAKSSRLTLLLCIFLGMLGVHRFYVGKIGTGILMLCSGGVLGIWVLIDLILITKNKFEDKQGAPLKITHNLSPIKETLLIAGVLMSWFAVFIASVAALLMYMTSGLIQVVDLQLTALQTGNMEQAYSCTSKEFQKIFSLERFNQYIEQFPALKNNNSSHFSERKIVNNTGYLMGILTAKDGTKTPIVYQLIKEEGQWKILNIKTPALTTNNNSKGQQP